MANAIRGLVSKKKRRFQENGFDLDLSYINDRIIAMGFPSEGREGIYRNNMRDVQRFFETYHKGHHRVYNLCSEREYAPSSFESCTRFGFADHNPCKLSVLLAFCQDVHDWLSKDPKNVAAIHCKAGKGRTGLVIACYLQYAKIARTPDEALKIFADARTKNSKGVTIPSQLRYVRYFGEFLKRYISVGHDFPFDHPQKIVFTGIQMTGKADFDVGGGCDPYCRIFLPDGTEIYNMKKDKNYKIKNWKGTPTFRLNFAVPVQGDFHVMVYDADGFSKDDKMFGFWLHTEFIRKSEIKLRKVELDAAIKDKKHHKFNKEFEISLFFSDVHSDDHEWVDEIHGAHATHEIDDGDDDDDDDEDEDEEKSNGPTSPSNANKPVATGIAARMASLNMAATGKK